MPMNMWACLLFICFVCPLRKYREKQSVKRWVNREVGGTWENIGERKLLSEYIVRNVIKNVQRID